MQNLLDFRDSCLSNEVCHYLRCQEHLQLQRSQLSRLEGYEAERAANSFFKNNKDFRIDAQAETFAIQQFWSCKFKRINSYKFVFSNFF